MKRKSIYSPEHQELVTLLFDLRRQADLTQSEAAEALGRPQTYVSAVEVGRRGLDLVQIREFCAVYDISLTKFAEQFEKRLDAAVSKGRPPRLSSRGRKPLKSAKKSHSSTKRR